MKTIPTAIDRRKPKVGMISLGCAKNLVDAEIMLGSVLQRGMEITSRAEDADVLVVNTCAFIDSAKEESIEAILEAHQQRGLNKRSDQKLIVSGCNGSRASSEKKCPKLMRSSDWIKCRCLAKSWRNS
jgi:ribosomal protein S12 methylthiotransferase